MDNKPVIKILLAILMVFFCLHAVSHVFMKVGEGRSGGRRSGMFKISALTMPLDAEPFYRYAYALLFEHAEGQSKEMIAKSIRAFEQALARNVLFYRAYYYLGKARFMYDRSDSVNVARARQAFKRAARVRGSKNRDIALDTLMLMLSQWPFLDEQDKAFSRQLMEKSVSLLGREDFAAVLEVWRLYSRDSDFFKGIIENPEYFQAIARELSRMDGSLRERHEYLAAYEVYRLEQLKIAYHRYREQPGNRFQYFKNLYAHDGIEGYYRLANSPDFDEDAYRDLRKQLNAGIIRAFFQQPQENDKEKKIIQRYILDYLDRLLSKKELAALADLLEKNGFFASRDLDIFYIRQRLRFKQGDYQGIVEDVESLRQSLAFVRREQMDDYTAICLLEADAYYETGRPDRAMAVLEEMERVSPGLPGTYLRMMKIEAMAGESDRESREKYRQVMDSRFIEPRAASIRKTVYLVDSNEIVIRINEAFREAMKTGNLLQVFVDGKIRFEGYLNRLADEITVPVDKGHFTGCDVSIKII
jgi:hypothetical protein